MLRFLERQKISVAYLPEVLVKMRVGGESGKNLKNIIVGNMNVLKAFKKNGIMINEIVYLLRRLTPKIYNRIKCFF